MASSAVYFIRCTLEAIANKWDFLQHVARNHSKASGLSTSRLNTRYHSILGGERGMPSQGIPNFQSCCSPQDTQSSLTSFLLRGVANYREKKSTAESNLFYSAVYGLWDFYVIICILQELRSSHYKHLFIL